MAVPVTVVNGSTIVGFDRAGLEQALRSSPAGRPSFGLRITDASRITQRQGVVPVFGAYVARVASGSVGERAGLRADDIITEFNLRPVSNADDLEKAIKTLSRGSRVSIGFIRGDQQLRGETMY
ncbi:PDZ domain-containing protein [Chloroflexota bacterium]